MYGYDALPVRLATRLPLHRTSQRLPSSSASEKYEMYRGGSIFVSACVLQQNVPESVRGYIATWSLLMCHCTVHTSVYLFYSVKVSSSLARGSLVYSAHILLVSVHHHRDMLSPGCNCIMCSWSHRWLLRTHIDVLVFL